MRHFQPPASRLRREEIPTSRWRAAGGPHDTLAYRPPLPPGPPCGAGRLPCLLPSPTAAAHQPLYMLLRWLLIACYALGMLVVRTRGLCGRPCADEETSPRGRRRQRDRAQADSPHTLARSRPPLRRPLGSDPRLAMLSGIIVSVITLLATARWTPGFGRVRGSARKLRPGARSVAQLPCLFRLRAVFHVLTAVCMCCRCSRCLGSSTFRPSWPCRWLVWCWCPPSLRRSTSGTQPF